jgi:Tfp pilus assembly protein PilN
MSVRVNLLPREVAAKRAERRTATISFALVALFALLLGGLYLLKLNEIQQAEEERDEVQAEVSRLEAEVASLEQFRQLADELEARNALLAAAMANEISYARVLNDLSITFPASSSLRSLQLSALDPTATEAQIGTGGAVAALSYDGYSVERFAPGVEAVIVEFDKVRSFFDTYLGSAQLEDIEDTEVTAYQGTVQLNDEAYTRRYADGLPEELGR